MRADAGRRGQPGKFEGRAVRLVRPSHAQPRSVDAGGGDARSFRQIDDVHPTLAAVNIAVRRHVVAQPQAREFGAAGRPRDAHELRRHLDARAAAGQLVARAHASRRPATAARAPNLNK
jgi:hypothetical protein